jgi:hypothetical protein
MFRLDLKNSQILPNKIGRRFLVTAKQFRGRKMLIQYF